MFQGCIKAAARLRKLSHITRLTDGFQSDLRWWHLFATHWNGTSFLNNCSLDCSITIDASGAWDCEAVFGPQWMLLAWSKEWAWMDIMAKECTNHFKLCSVWGPLLSGSNVQFKCDNSGVVDSINKGSSKESLVMHLL